jgi:hypothetical protein
MSYLEELNRYTDSLSQQRENFEGLINQASARYSEHAKEQFDRITEAMNMAGGTVNALGMGIHGLARAKQSIDKLAKDAGIDTTETGDAGGFGMWRNKTDVLQDPRETDIPRNYGGRLGQRATPAKIDPDEIQMGDIGEIGDTVEQQIADRGGEGLLASLKKEPVAQDDSITAKGRKLYGEGDITTQEDLDNITTGGLRGASADESIAKMRQGLSAAGGEGKLTPVSDARPIYENQELPAIPEEEQTLHPNQSKTTIDTGETRAVKGTTQGDAQLQAIQKRGAELKDTPQGVETGRIRPTYVEPRSDEEIARGVQGKQPARKVKVGDIELDDIDPINIDFTKVAGGTRVSTAGAADAGAATQKATATTLGRAKLGTTITPAEGSRLEQEAGGSAAEAPDATAAAGAEAKPTTGTATAGAEVPKPVPEAELGEASTATEQGGLRGLIEGGAEALGLGGEEATGLALGGIGLEAIGGVGEVVGAGLLVGGILHDVLSKPQETDQVLQGAMAGKIGFNPNALGGGEGGGVSGTA